jgi:DNA-directed RNA polymerase specialized sigma24 family protein
LWFTTRSALFRSGEEAWEEAARYGPPLARLLARRYGWLSAEDREDLLQDILLDIKQKLATAHDPTRHRFRALLRVVVQRRVVDLLRRCRPRAGGQLQAELLSAPPVEEVEAIDLEASLTQAFALCRDHFTQGPQADRQVLYVLVDRIVHGHRSVDIALQENLSPHQVARLLARGRKVLMQKFLQQELDALSPQQLEAGLTLFQRCLRQPKRWTQELEGCPDPRLRSAFESFWERFQAALPIFAVDRSSLGQELLRGVEFLS